MAIMMLKWIFKTIKTIAKKKYKFTLKQIINKITLILLPLDSQPRRKRLEVEIGLNKVIKEEEKKNLII